MIIDSNYMKFLAKNNFIRQILQETKKIIFSPSLKMRRIMMTSKEIQNLYFQVKSSKQRQKCPCCLSNTRIECPDGFFAMQMERVQIVIYYLEKHLFQTFTP